MHNYPGGVFCSRSAAHMYHSLTLIVNGDIIFHIGARNRSLKGLPNFLVISDSLSTVLKISLNKWFIPKTDSNCPCIAVAARNYHIIARHEQSPGYNEVMIQHELHPPFYASYSFSQHIRFLSIWPVSFIK